MWETLQNHCTRILDRQLITKQLRIDYEKSAHNSIFNVFLRCNIVYCIFHFTQSWFRRIQCSSNLLIKIILKLKLYY